MKKSWQAIAAWMAAGSALAVAGGVVLARLEIDRQRQAFETDARIVHRLLSQQVVQLDAILGSLALLQPGLDASGAAPPEQRLPSLYPHILSVQRRDRGQTWPDEALSAAEADSRLARRAVLAQPDLHSGRYRLVFAAEPTAYALTIDMRSLVPWSDWPMNPSTSPVHVALADAGQRFELQPGDAQALASSGGWRFEFNKPLAAQSQPFEVVALRQMGWHQLPWLRMLAWSLGVAAVLSVLAQLQRQRTARRRAEELLRLGQVARLNMLGELAAGVAHELNQPLTAVLANTQAAQRLLSEDPPDQATARTAMGQAVAQARRAVDVVGRLRRLVERPEAHGTSHRVDLADTLRRALHLLEPECLRRGVVPQLRAPEPVFVQADPVALDQIVHNLLMNALQALESVDVVNRTMTVSVTRQGAQGALQVADTGPGIPPELLPRLFEPFFSARQGGLGLGLTLCETLASGMDGSLTAANRPEGGALFCLRLPLQDTTT